MSVPAPSKTSHQGVVILPTQYEPISLIPIWTLALGVFLASGFIGMATLGFGMDTHMPSAALKSLLLAPVFLGAPALIGLLVGAVVVIRRHS